MEEIEEDEGAQSHPPSPTEETPIDTEDTHFVLLFITLVHPVFIFSLTWHFKKMEHRDGHLYARPSLCPVFEMGYLLKFLLGRFFSQNKKDETE